MMYDGMRATNKWAALYFTALMAIGYYVLFNLLVAILVEGFTNSGVSTTKFLPNEPHRLAINRLMSVTACLTDLRKSVSMLLKGYIFLVV